MFPFQEYIDAHPETIVLDPLPAIRTLLDRSKSYELVRKIEAYMKGVDTGGRPTAGVTRRSLGGARKGLVSLSMLGQEAVESRVGVAGGGTCSGAGEAFPFLCEQQSPDVKARDALWDSGSSHFKMLLSCFREAAEWQ